jgi:membrane protein required for beta-lactamase induction
MAPSRLAEGHQQLRKSRGGFRRSNDIPDLVHRRERTFCAVRSRVRFLSTLLLLLPPLMPLLLLLPLHLPLHLPLPSLELFLLVAY